MMRSTLFAVLLVGCWRGPDSPPPAKPAAPVEQTAEPDSVAQSSPPEGEEDGVEGGVVGGVVGGTVAGAPPPPPPPPPGPPQNVPPTLLESLRVAGTKYITPDDQTKTLIARSGKDKIVGSWKLCVNVNGDVTQANQLKSTGFPDYDAKIQNEMRQWQYKPYEVNGKAVPVCTAVTFIYSQVAPPPPAQP